MFSPSAFLSGFDPTRYTQQSTPSNTAQAEKEAELARQKMAEAVRKWRELQAQQKAQGPAPRTVPILPDPGPTQKEPVTLQPYTLPIAYKKVIILGTGIMLFLVAFNRLK